MPQKLIIILANSGPDNPVELASPIIQASVAAAMSHAVEVICAGASVKLLKAGIASEIRIKAGEPRSVYDFIKEAHAAGVKFFCCAPALDLFDIHRDDLIPECSGVVGTAHLVEQIMSGESRLLTY